MQLLAFARNEFALGNAAIMVNEGLPLHIIGDLRRNYDLSQMTVGLLGMAFKAESDDPRASLSYKFKKALAGLAREVLTTDPFVTNDPDLLPLDEVIARSDLLILCTPHASTRAPICKGKPVVDVWGLLENAQRRLLRRWARNSTSSFRSIMKAKTLSPYCRGLAREVKIPARVLICYDSETDDTLPAVRDHADAYSGLPVEFVRNLGRGAHAAVMAGFAASTAPLVVVYPADDDFNTGCSTAWLRWQGRAAISFAPAGSCRAGRCRDARGSRPCWCGRPPFPYTVSRGCRRMTPPAAFDCFRAV